MFLRFRFIFSALLLCLPMTASAQASDPYHLPIIVRKPQVGSAATDKNGFRLGTALPFQGELVYAWDTGPLFYTGSGTEQPGQSFLTLHMLGGPPAKTSTYPVTIPKYLNIYGPLLSPDGNKLLFKVGDSLTSSWGTYRPVLLDLRTQKKQEVPAASQSVGDLTMRWSSDGRYLAYLEDGFEQAFGHYQTATLFIYDTQTGKTRKVVENDGVIDSFAWTTRDRLLYSAFPPGEPPARPPADLYEFSTTTGKSVLLRHDAYRPVPSPDGKFVAFISVQNPDEKVKSKSAKKLAWRFTYEYAVNKYLVLWSRRNNTTRLIRRETLPQFSDLRWQPDSQGLVLAGRRIENMHQDRVEIAQYSLATGQTRAITHLLYPDYNHLDQSTPLFAPLTVSQDGKWLFYKLTQPYEAVKTNAGQFLRAVRLSDGKVVTLCFYPGHGDLDWREQPQPK